MCETLLEQERQDELSRTGLKPGSREGRKSPQDQMKTTKGSGKFPHKRMKPLQPIIAAYYECNFQYLVLGHSGTRTVRPPSSTRYNGERK